MTAPIASDPYIEDAPSLRTSTLSTAAVGIVLISTEPSAPSPLFTHLLPSTRTRVLCAPRFLKSILTDPSPPLLYVLFKPDP